MKCEKGKVEAISLGVSSNFSCHSLQPLFLEAAVEVMRQGSCVNHLQAPWRWRDVPIQAIG